METIIKIGERIKHLREQRNYSQDYVASKLSISQRAYSKIETGETNLSVDKLLKIAEVLEMSLNKILDMDGNAVYNNFHTHNGEGIVMQKTYKERENDLVDQLLKSKDEQIALLKTHNELLTKQFEVLSQK